MTEERKIYMERKNIVHTSEEILAAFEDNTAIVFELSCERTPSAKSNLFGGIASALLSKYGSYLGFVS